MGRKSKIWPVWVKSALQGVTYWIGHHRCFYKGHPLTEGAIIAEICKLIKANLPKDFRLSCERQYSSYLAPDVKLKHIATPKRADLVISEKVTGQKKYVLRYIIEVKRYLAAWSQIESDLRRLVEFRKYQPDVHTFLFVVSEAKIPAKFVTEDGRSKKEKFNISASDGYYKVLSTWKAAHGFTLHRRAQYACLIETYTRGTARGMS